MAVKKLIARAVAAALRKERERAKRKAAKAKADAKRKAAKAKVDAKHQAAKAKRARERAIAREKRARERAEAKLALRDARMFERLARAQDRAAEKRALQLAKDQARIRAAEASAEAARERYHAITTNPHAYALAELLKGKEIWEAPQLKRDPHTGRFVKQINKTKMRDELIKRLQRETGLSESLLFSTFHGSPSFKKAA